MAVAGVSGVNNYPSYGQLASGTRLQSAADGAAELGIAEREESYVRGDKAGIHNSETAKDMLNIADGALGNVTDSLQRMRELAVQASNGLYTDSDKQAIQAEIDQLKQGIADVAGNTNFNTKNLLDGSQSDFNIATDSNGNGIQVSTGNATLQQLGIEDFDVTGDFDLQTIDDALEKLNSSRGEIGAQTNALDYQIDMSEYRMQNTVAAQSRLEDLDMEPAISDRKKQDLLDTYQVMMQKRQQEDEQERNAALFR